MAPYPYIVHSHIGNRVQFRHTQCVCFNNKRTISTATVQGLSVTADWMCVFVQLLQYLCINFWPHWRALAWALSWSWQWLLLIIIVGNKAVCSCSQSGRLSLFTSSIEMRNTSCCVLFSDVILLLHLYPWLLWYCTFHQFLISSYKQFLIESLSNPGVSYIRPTGGLSKNS